MNVWKYDAENKELIRQKFSMEYTQKRINEIFRLRAQDSSG